MSDCEHEITAKCRFLDFGESIVTLYWTSPLVSNTQSQVRGNSSLFWAEEAAWGCPAPPPQLAPGRYTAALTELQAAHTLRAQYGPCTVTAATAQSPFLHWGALAQHPAPAWALWATAPCCTLTRCSPYHTHVGPHNAVLAQHTCLMYHKNTNWLPTEIREENMHSYSSANYDLLTANFIPMAIAPKAAS